MEGVSFSSPRRKRDKNEPPDLSNSKNSTHIDTIKILAFNRGTLKAFK